MQASDAHGAASAPDSGPPSASDTRDSASFLRSASTLVLVAAGAGLFAVAFRASLAAAYRDVFHATNVLDAIRTLPAWLRIAVPAIGGLAAGILSNRRAARQGVGNVMEAVALGRVHLSVVATAWRAMASWMAIATGMSIGREGPLIEFGASLGATISRATKLPIETTRVLVSAGTAAGFAAAYNTPFAALLFVVETMAGIVALDVVLAAMVAIVIGTTITRAVVGGGPIYGLRAFALGSPVELLLYGLVGVLAALTAAMFKRMLEWSETLWCATRLGKPWTPMVGGLVVGVIAVFVPEVVGNGYEPLHLVLDQQLGLVVMASLLVLKMVATSASVGSGVPGGVFTPTLLIGGVFGALCGQAFAALGFIAPASFTSYALAGMAATTAASIHAPLTAAVMIFELSGDYPMALPLLFATAVATLLSRALGSESVYMAELRRRGIGWTLTLDGRLVERR
jgi:CIC family chloride channel protein